MKKIIPIIFIFTLFMQKMFAQQDIYIASGGTLYTHSGAQLGIFGNIINDASGGLNHNSGGNVYLYRRAANGTGNSRIYDGPGAPSFAGNYNSGGAYVKFWNLFTDNNTGTATPSGTPINGSGGSGQISIEQETRISGTHSFVNGMVWTPRNNWKHAYIHYDNTSAGYTGNTALKHIDGYAAKTGTGDFDFPIGDGTSLRMSGLRSPVNGTFKSAYFNKNSTLGTTGISGNNAGSGSYAGNIVRIDQTEFWDIDGTASSNFMLTALNSVAGYSDWNTLPNFFASATNKITMTGFDGTWENLGISPAVSSITQDGQFVTTTASTPDVNFSAYTWAITDIVLAINLEKFNAVPLNCKTQLNWEVDNISLLQNYELQRSENGSSFLFVATIPAGNSSSNSYITEQPGLNAFYRIKLNFKDGSFKYSPVLPVEKKCNGENLLALKIYPNPVKSVLQLIITSEKKTNYNIVITDLAGQRIFYKNVAVEKGNNLVSIDLKYFPAAVYNLCLYDATNKSVLESLRVVKINE